MSDYEVHSTSTVSQILSEVRKTTASVRSIIAQSNVLGDVCFSTMETLNNKDPLIYETIYNHTHGQVMICYQAADTETKPHVHTSAVEIFFVFSGEIECLGSVCGPGDVLRVNAGVVHSVRALESATFLAALQPKDKEFGVT